MSTHRKVYRFRMRPTKVQEQSLNQMAGARRWVWNWALRRWKDHHAATGKSIPLGRLSAELTALKNACDELGGVQGKWQAADGARGKARFGGEKVGPNPTDRTQPGTKRSLIVERDGGPLGVVIAGANVVERPDPGQVEQHLCLDKGYDNPTGHEVVERHGYVGHIRPIREDRRPCGVRAAARPAGGWSSGRWPGCRSAVGCWSATISMPRTSWG
jgi:hypothetical protein